MAIVGTAFVRLKVLSDKLAGDIKRGVEQSVSDAAPNLERSGDRIGETIGERVSGGLENSVEDLHRIASDTADDIGRIMGDRLGESFRTRARRTLTQSFGRLRSTMSDAGDQLSDAFSTFQTGMKKQLKKINIGSFLVSGIAFAVTALPSLLSGAGAIIGAYAASAVSAISAIGPAAAGAAIAGVAAFSALKISSKLFSLAMEVQTPQLEDYQQRLTDFKATIGTPVQEGLISGLNASMRITTPVIKALTGELANQGIALGDLAIGIANVVAKQENLGRLRQILNQNSTFLGFVRTGLEGLTQGFIIFLAALQPVYDFFGPLIADMGTYVANTLAAKEASGELGGFITRTLDALRQFSGITADLAIGIYNVFKAANPAGQSLLDSLQGIAARFREWTGDEANQARMTTFFNNMRTIIAQVNDILGQLVGSGLRALEGTDLGALNRGLETLRSFGAPIAQMFNAIKDSAGPALQTAFQNFADVFVQLANSGVIGILAQAFGTLLAIISQILAIPGVGTILSFVAGLAVLLKTVGLLVNIFGLLWPAISLIINVVKVAIAIFGGIPLAIAAVVAALVYFFGFTETGRAIIAAAWAFIKNAISTAIDAVIAAFHAVVGALSTAASFIASTAQSIWSAITNAFNAVLNTVTSVWNSIVSAIQTAITTVYNVVTTVINAVSAFINPILTNIATVFTTVFTTIQTVVGTAIGIIYEIWIRVFPILLLPLRVFEGLAILAWQTISDVITTTVTFLSNLLTTVWNAIYGFLSTVLTAIAAFFVGIWTAITDTVSTAVAAVESVVTTVWNAIYGFLSAVLSAIGSYVAGVWNTITSVISSAMSAISSVVSSVWSSISGFISGVVNSIRSTVSSVWNSITDSIRSAMESARSIISSIWDSIQARVSSAVSAVQSLVSNVWSGLQNVGSGILNGLKSAVNTVIGAANSVIGGLNTMINAANQLPGIDIPTIPSIPRLAKGGIVDPRGGGTLAMIAEAGRPERVEPLDKTGLSQRDHAIISKLAGGGGGPILVRVMIGDTELTDFVRVIVDDANDDNANTLVTGRKGS